ncbi:hypothetical protein [Halomonas sp. NO4]|uniref:hypothetical protein n=1 Tax=Halomonas sp. NO4 TaxID=2484813 RepID=UPI0013D5A559|nr:hypothetical protein [Halomonas sp. NO4]
MNDAGDLLARARARGAAITPSRVSLNAEEARLCARAIDERDDLARALATVRMMAASGLNAPTRLEHDVGGVIEVVDADRLHRILGLIHRYVDGLDNRHGGDHEDTLETSKTPD